METILVGEQKMLESLSTTTKYKDVIHIFVPCSCRRIFLLIQLFFIIELPPSSFHLADGWASLNEFNVKFKRECIENRVA